MTEQRWRNRIVGEAELDPAELVAHPANWRTHPVDQQRALAATLDAVGWVQRVIVNRRTGRMIDGHLRAELAVREHEPTVPVLYVDLDEAEEKLTLAALDPIGALARGDATALDALLAGINDDALGALLRETAEAAGFLPSSFNPDAEWSGMPSFDQPDAFAVRTLKVHFATDDDAAAFAAVVGIPLGERTASIWYPTQPARVEHRRYTVEDGEPALSGLRPD